MSEAKGMDINMKRLVGKKLLSTLLAVGVLIGTISIPGYSEAYTGTTRTFTFSQLMAALTSRSEQPAPAPVEEVKPTPVVVEPAPVVVKPSPVVVNPSPEVPAPAPVEESEDKGRVFPLLPGEEAVEKYFFTMINKERTSRGLKPLTLDADLTRLARFKSHDMKENKFFAHLSPTHGRFSDMLKKEGVVYSASGENLGRGSRAVTIHYMFMESDGHRRNLLKSNYTHVGIGVVKTSSRGYLVTQHYLAK